MKCSTQNENVNRPYTSVHQYKHLRCPDYHTPMKVPVAKVTTSWTNLKLSSEFNREV